MKIGIVRTDLASAGGAERYTRDLLLQLVARGHEPHVFTIEEVPSLPPQVVVHRCILNHTSSTRNSQNSHRRRRKSSRLQRHRAFEKWLGDAVKNANFDVLLTMERVLPSDVFSAGGGVHREWLQICQSSTSFWKRWLIRSNASHRETLRAEVELFRSHNTRMVVCNSQMVAAEIARHYAYPREQIRIVPNGVDFQQFQIPTPEKRATLRQAQNLETNDIAALFIGSGFWRKGLDIAIELTVRWNELEKVNGRNVHLFVVGKGKTGIYKRQARRLGIQKNVHFVGATSPDRVLDWYQRSDILLFPTRYDSFGLVGLEANACGVPAIATRRAGYSEHVQNGVNGVVLESDPTISSTRCTIEADARQVFEFYEKRAPAEKVCAAISHLTVEANAAQLLNALEEAVTWPFATRLST